MYDGSFTSLNWDLCKFAASMPDDLDGSLDDPDFLEWELVKDCYRRCLLSVDSDWFTIFGQPDVKGVNRLISLSKKGNSKYYSRKLKALSGITDNAFRPSDKLILGLILQPDEYTSPVSYEQLFEDSHGSKVPGYGKPHTGKNHNLEKQHDSVEVTFKNMRIVNFRPWAWSPVMTIHYNKTACKLEEVFGVVKAQTKTRSVMSQCPYILQICYQNKLQPLLNSTAKLMLGVIPNSLEHFVLL